ncbi:MAG: glycosyl hydrolase family protein [Acidobacteriota bacterium]
MKNVQRTVLSALITLTLSFCGIGALLLAGKTSLAAGQQAQEAAASVVVNWQKPGRAIPPDFLGFSYEAPVLTHKYFNKRNAAFIRMLDNLGKGVLRFGGNSVEFTNWARHREPRPSWAHATVTRKDLNRLFAFSRKIDWPVMLGLNLGHYDPNLFAKEGAYAVKRGGPMLLSLEIGNEPDIFNQNGLRPHNWDYAEFHRQFQTYVRAIRARAPDAPISGPTTCCKQGLDWFPKFLAAEHTNLVLATHHIYPMGAVPTIPPTSPEYASISNMLSPPLMSRVAAEVRKLASDAKPYDLPLRIAETNSAYDGGQNGVSNVYAAALWGADYSFTLAENGAAGLNFHGGFACRGYTAICISDGHYHAQPLYYGMLLFHSALPGRLVPVEVHAAGNLTAYGVLQQNGTLRVVLINKDEQKAMKVDITAEPYRMASALRLTGPSLSATSGITFGGKAVSADGSWSPGPREPVPFSDGEFRITLPAASAAEITFQK